MTNAQLIHSGMGLITTINVSGPIQTTGGTNPTLSIAAATNSVAGSMSAADKTKLDLSGDPYVWSATTNQPGTTLFAVPGLGPAQSSEVQIPIPRAGTLKALFASASTAPGLTHTDTITVRKNGVDTSIVASLVGAVTAGNDISHTVSVVAGDLLSVKIVQGASSGGAGYEIVVALG